MGQKTSAQKKAFWAVAFETAENRWQAYWSLIDPDFSIYQPNGRIKNGLMTGITECTSTSPIQAKHFTVKYEQGEKKVSEYELMCFKDHIFRDSLLRPNGAYKQPEYAANAGWMDHDILILMINCIHQYRCYHSHIIHQNIDLHKIDSKNLLREWLVKRYELVGDHLLKDRFNDCVVNSQTNTWAILFNQSHSELSDEGKLFLLSFFSERTVLEWCISPVFKQKAEKETEKRKLQFQKNRLRFHAKRLGADTLSPLHGELDTTDNKTLAKEQQNTESLFTQFDVFRKTVETLNRQRDGFALLRGVSTEKVLELKKQPNLELDVLDEERIKNDARFNWTEDEKKLVLQLKPQGIHPMRRTEIINFCRSAALWLTNLATEAKIDLLFKLQADQMTLQTAHEQFANNQGKEAKTSLKPSFKKLTASNLHRLLADDGDIVVMFSKEEDAEKAENIRLKLHYTALRRLVLFHFEQNTPSIDWIEKLKADATTTFGFFKKNERPKPYNPERKEKDVLLLESFKEKINDEANLITRLMRIEEQVKKLNPKKEDQKEPQKETEKNNQRYRRLRYLKNRQLIRLYQLYLPINQEKKEKTNHKKPQEVYRYLSAKRIQTLSIYHYELENGVAQGLRQEVASLLKNLVSSSGEFSSVQKLILDAETLDRLLAQVLEHTIETFLPSMKNKNYLNTGSAQANLQKRLSGGTPTRQNTDFDFPVTPSDKFWENAFNGLAITPPKERQKKYESKEKNKYRDTTDFPHSKSRFYYAKTEREIAQKLKARFNNQFYEQLYKTFSSSLDKDERDSNKRRDTSYNLSLINDMRLNTAALVVVADTLLEKIDPKFVHLEKGAVYDKKYGSTQVTLKTKDFSLTGTLEDFRQFMMYTQSKQQNLLTQIHKTINKNIEMNQLKVFYKAFQKALIGKNGLVQSLLDWESAVVTKVGENLFTKEPQGYVSFSNILNQAKTTGINYPNKNKNNDNFQDIRNKAFHMALGGLYKELNPKATNTGTTLFEKTGLKKAITDYQEQLKFI
jgi:hypothetical protein